MKLDSVISTLKFFDIDTISIFPIRKDGTTRMLITLFRGAGATGHVFLLKHGKAVDQGLAYSGLLGPQTIVAVVPTTSQIIDFSVDARTLDKQNLTVTGNLKVRLDPATAVSQFDFTVNRKTGAYSDPWERTLHAIALERVLGPIHEKARELNIEEATQAHLGFEAAVFTAVTKEGLLTDKGIVVESCSIANIEADDSQVADAIGSKERQTMLAESDRATHNRRIKAAENDRSVRTYEAETALKLEQERAKLIEEQSRNKQKEAEADAAATKARMGAYNDIPAGEMLGAALVEMARGGRVGSLAIVPELLAALDRK